MTIKELWSLWDEMSTDEAKSLIALAENPNAESGIYRGVPRSLPVRKRPEGWRSNSEVTA